MAYMALGVSYIPAHLPDHIEADMRHLAAIGCTEVLFALQENHIYTLTGALHYGAQIAQQAGLRPLAVIWGFANTFGGGRISRIMLEDLDLWCQDEEDVPFAQACLNNPTLPQRFTEIAALCREHGYTGIFIDEPTKQECFCSYCQAAFRARYGGRLRAAKGSADYAAFRAETVRAYVATICRQVKALDADLATVTCVMPRDRDMWAAIAAISELDVLGTDPYWLLSRGHMTLEQAVADATEAKRLAEHYGKGSQVWLNCWGIPGGLEEEIYLGGRALAAVGCDSLYTWSFRGGLGTNEACERPDHAWASVVRLYGELAKG